MKAEFLPGNAITLLETGSVYFPALLAAIDAAQQEFLLETYIFEADTTGRMVAAALCRAAQRGVTVRVLVDGFGAPDFAGSLRPLLEAAGVQGGPSSPPKRPPRGLGRRWGARGQLQTKDDGIGDGERVSAEGRK